MAAFFDDGTGRRVELTSDLVLDLIQDGNDSEVQGLVDDDDPPPLPSRARNVAAPLSRRVRQEVQRGRSTRRSQRGRGAASRPSQRGQGHRNVPRRRVWRQIRFNPKPHDYQPRLPVQTIRTPLEFFKDYFDNNFFERAAFCTNTYHLRTTGRILNTSSEELKKFVGIHLIMGCISYPRLHMYWREEMQLKLIVDVMSRDRVKQLRSSLHVVEAQTAPPECASNSLWKVQPVIDIVKNTCDKLERQPGYYSIDEQMIPFCGVCPLGVRQVVKNKPRPQGLKVFVATTHDGLMIDFEVYRGAQSNFGDRSLGVGAAVVLHLSKSIPPGSCIYFDRYFSSVPLIDKLTELNLHGTGTIMLNRIPEQKNIHFKTDRNMARGESQQFVSGNVVVVKWKDNNSVLMTSNCTSADEIVMVKRWDKNTGQRGAFIDVPAPKVISHYNKYMGGVDVLDQSMEYYRTFMKTKKWPLKVILHFFDLAVVNSWRLYKIQCNAAGVRRVMDLLQFRLEIADGLTSTPARTRRDYESDDEEENVVPKKRYRPSNTPSMAKKYDGYEHYPTFDAIQNPRSCRLEGCTSRSKIRCTKCNVYLCLTRRNNCFLTYHTQ